jgi:hypothetical protein
MISESLVLTSKRSTSRPTFNPSKIVPQGGHGDLKKPGKRASHGLFVAITLNVGSQYNNGADHSHGGNSETPTRPFLLFYVHQKGDAKQCTYVKFQFFQKLKLVGRSNPC